MAERLGISGSYLNLIEHDERPVTVALLLKLGRTFGIDLQELSDDSERRLAASLREVFADAGLGAGAIDAGGDRRLVASAPKAGRAIVDLYRAWRTAREDAQALQLDLPGGRTRRVVLPTEEARDFFEAHGQSFPGDRGGRRGAGSLPATPDAEIRPRASPSGLLSARHRGRDRADGAMAGAFRRYDAEARTVGAVRGAAAAEPACSIWPISSGLWARAMRSTR